VETEPIFASLANVLKNYKNLDKVPPALSKFHLEELEVKLGIIQLCEALVFAHSSAQMTHLNINPESIFLTADGTWKLGAFNWAQFSAYKESGDQLFAYPEQDFTEMIPTKPIIDYAAPEAVFLNRFHSAADMFSLGCVVFELFTGAPMLQCRGNAASYKRQMQQLYPLSLDKIPTTLQAPLEQLLVVDPSKRLSAASFLQSEFFSDLTIRVLHYISHILEKDDRSKADFFKGLLTALPQFELTVIERKILPILLAELTKNPILVPFLLPCIFSIIEMTSSQPDRYGKAFFQSKILPALLPLFTIKEPIQIALLLLQRVDLLVKGLDEKLVNDHIAALFCFALDHDSLDLKLAALKVGPPIFSSFNYDRLKNAILPRLEAILSSGTVNSAVRVGCLSCFSRMIPLFSRTIVEEQLLPIILRSSSVDRTAAVQMATAGVCDVISKKFGEEITAIKVRNAPADHKFVGNKLIFLVLASAVDYSHRRGAHVDKTTV
jgi:SCY1-like protein 2